MTPIVVQFADASEAETHADVLESVPRRSAPYGLDALSATPSSRGFRADLGEATSVFQDTTTLPALHKRVVALLDRYAEKYRQQFGRTPAIEEMFDDLQAILYDLGTALAEPEEEKARPMTVLEPGTRVRLRGHPAAVTLRSATGSVLRPDERWEGFYIVRLDTPALYHWVDGRIEELPEIRESSVNLDILPQQ